MTSFVLPRRISGAKLIAAIETVASRPMAGQFHREEAEGGGHRAGLSSPNPSWNLIVAPEVVEDTSHLPPGSRLIQPEASYRTIEVAQIDWTTKYPSTTEMDRETLANAIAELGAKILSYIKDGQVPNWPQSIAVCASCKQPVNPPVRGQGFCTTHGIRTVTEFMLVVPYHAS